MARDVSQSTRDEIVSTGSNIAFLTMLVIESDELASPLYFVRNNKDIVSSAYDGSHTYLAANFSAKLPNQEESTVQDATITISGVTRQITEVVRSIISSPTVKIFIIREDTPDTIELGPYVFKLRGVSYDKTTISGSLLYEYTLRSNISTITINSRSFPGLF